MTAHTTVPTADSFVASPPTIPEVTVVMPCLNEAETLEECICETMAAFEDAGISGEVVIADNGSTDGSQSLATALGARVIDVAAKGYGNALRGGIEASRGEYIIMGDSDSSYNFGHIPRFVEKMREGYDLVMGNRFRGGIEPGAMPFLHKYLGNPVLSGIGKLFFKSPVSDFHCGLRGFRKDAFDRMELNTTGMEFASEMVIKATLKNMRITEVPTVLRPDGRSRPPHLRSWRDGWRHLRFMLLYAPNWLFVYTGATFFMVGLMLISLIALQDQIIIRGASLNVNASMTASMMLLVGFQLVISGEFCRRFGVAIGTHPPENRQRKPLWFFPNLEQGIIIGVILCLLGIGLLSSAVYAWKLGGFGAMPSTLTVRRVIPAITLISLGVQSVFGSFLISLPALIPSRTSQKTD